MIALTEEARNETTDDDDGEAQAEDKNPNHTKFPIPVHIRRKVGRFVRSYCC